MSIHETDGSAQLEPRSAAVEPLVLSTGTGDLARTGRWVVPTSVVAECKSGSILLDFTQAECSHRAVTVQAKCTSGSVTIIVPAGWEVSMDKVDIGSGAVDNHVTEQGSASQPVLHVQAEVGSGKITVRH